MNVCFKKRALDKEHTRQFPCLAAVFNDPPMPSAPTVFLMSINRVVSLIMNKIAFLVLLSVVLGLPNPDIDYCTSWLLSQGFCSSKSCLRFSPLQWHFSLSTKISCSAAPMLQVHHGSQNSLDPSGIFKQARASRPLPQCQYCIIV